MKMIVLGVSAVVGLVSAYFWYEAITAALAKSDETKSGLDGAAKNTGTSIAYYDILDPFFGPTTIFMNADETTACQANFDGLTVQLVPKNASWQNGVEFQYSDWSDVDESTGMITMTKDCVRGSRGGFANIYTGIAQVPYPACTAEPCPYSVLPKLPDGEPDWSVQADFRYDIQCPVGMGCWGLNRLIIDKTKDTMGNFYSAAETNIQIGAALLILSVIGCVAAACMPGDEQSSDAGAELIES